MENQLSVINNMLHVWDCLTSLDGECWSWTLTQSVALTSTPHFYWSIINFNILVICVSLILHAGRRDKFKYSNSSKLFLITLVLQLSTTFYYGFVKIPVNVPQHQITVQFKKNSYTNSVVIQTGMDTYKLYGNIEYCGSNSANCYCEDVNEAITILDEVLEMYLLSNNLSATEENNSKSIYSHSKMSSEKAHFVVGQIVNYSPCLKKSYLRAENIILEHMSPIKYVLYFINVMPFVELLVILIALIVDGGTVFGSETSPNNDKDGKDTLLLTI